MIANHEHNVTFSVTPIGYITRSERSTFIKVFSTFTAALKELNTFSHAQIIWWIDRCDNPDDRKTLVCERPPFEAPPLGVFSCRSPMRPNVLGLSAVKILSVDEISGLVKIQEIDADNNSPVLDIKAYLPMYDRVKEVGVPGWALDLPLWIP